MINQNQVMKILVIEDDPTISQNIKETLDGEGYEVDIAFDGLVAEKKLKKNDYDCVILDINLPHKNGLELCKYFRSFNANTPVIMLTAFDELEDKVEGYHLGADDYLTKPFYMQELTLKVRSWIKRNQARTGDFVSDTIVIHDLVVSQKSKTVRRKDVEINLTPREYQILLKLVLANGELITKKDIIKEIWGNAFEANTNTIEVFINLLRNKIDKPFAKKLVKTKIGFGYYIDTN